MAARFVSKCAERTGRYKFTAHASEVSSGGRPNGK
jgi:hypothetical protein